MEKVKMTTEELVKALRRCASENCEKCPLKDTDKFGNMDCDDTLMSVAADRLAESNVILNEAVDIIIESLTFSFRLRGELSKAKAQSSNGRSAIDTNKRLSEAVLRMSGELEEYRTIAAEYGLSIRSMLDVAATKQAQAIENADLKKENALLRSAIGNIADIANRTKAKRKAEERRNFEVELARTGIWPE